MLKIAAGLAALIMLGDAPAAVQDDAEVRLHQDWAWLGRYRAEDDAQRAGLRRPDVVFIGDSITRSWIDKRSAFFRPGLLNRGIGGQTSAQILLRFRQDVIDLNPLAVHIMMGTNDIAANTGPITLEGVEENFETVCELARAHGIRVILAATPPAASFPWRPGLETADKIRTLNAWIKAYATRTGAVYADYTSVLDDGQGGMKPGLAYDGVHPTEAGYEAMAPVTRKAIAEALKPGPQNRAHGRRGQAF